MAGSRPKFKVSFTEKDLGMGHLLREAAKLRKKPFVKAGVTQKKGSRIQEGGRKTVAYIAGVHEYGSPDEGIPERSWMRSTVDKNRKKYDDHIAILKDKIFDADAGMTTERALGLIGQEVAADMKATIRAKIPPGLKEATIRRKNKAVISKAAAQMRKLEAKKSQRGYLTQKEGARYEAHGSIVASGGASTPLIDKGQFINAISYEVVKDGGSDGVDSPEGSTPDPGGK